MQVKMIKYFLLTFLIFINVYSNVEAAAAPGTVIKNNPASFSITQPPGFGVQIPGQKNGTPSGSAEEVVGVILKNVIALFFAVGGIGVVIFFLWGAVDWIISGGDKEKVASARKKITNALIGLALLALSFFIISIIGKIIGFNPLGNLQIRGLGNNNPIISP